MFRRNVARLSVLSGMLLLGKAGAQEQHCPCSFDILQIHAVVQVGGWDIAASPADSTGELNVKMPDATWRGMGLSGEVNYGLTIVVDTGGGTTTEVTFSCPEADTRATLDVNCFTETHKTTFMKNCKITAVQLAQIIADTEGSVNRDVGYDNALSMSYVVNGFTIGFENFHQVTCPDDLSDDERIAIRRGRANEAFHAVDPRGR